jgi:hypothetical protein
LNILKDFKVLSRFMQKWIQPPACSDQAHFHLMKKSAKVQLYFGLDCGMMEFFTYEPQSKEQLISLSHFWTRFGEKGCGLSTCKPWSEQAGGLEAFLHEAAQNFEVVSSCFKYSELKLKSQKPVVVDVLFKAYPMVPLSCRSNLAGRYL